MNKIYGRVGGTVYIGCWVIIAILDVGKVPKTFEVYSWYLPLLVFIHLTPAFILGFLAGKEN